MSNGQLRSIVDRILRLKAEQDDLAKDIREIYAEAKSSGFDKTALGKVVSHVRKREKLGADQMAEVESVFDTYLHAYLGTGIARAHTHETEPQRSPAAQSLSGPTDFLKSSDGQGGDESPVNNSPETANETFSADTRVEGRCVHTVHPLQDQSETTPSTIVQFNRDETTEERCLRLRPHCLNPSACAGVGKNHCFGCRKAVTSMTGEPA